MMRQNLLLFFILIHGLAVFSQQEYVITHERRELFFTEIFPESYDDTLMRDAIFYHLNLECQKLNIRQFKMQKILEYTALDQVEFIAKRDITRINDVPDRKKIAARLYEYDAGNQDANEIIYKALVAKGKTLLTYDEVAYDIAYTLFSRSRIQDILKNPRYIFIGIASQLDKEGKKVYISLNFGNYSIYSVPRNEIKSSGLPITINQYGLHPYNERFCKSCERFSNIYSLHSMLRVEKGVIYFETNDLRALRKLLRNEKDGLAADVVMWEQYPCKGQNTVNNIFVNKGYLTKPIYYENFVRVNEYQGRLGQRELKLVLGKIPEGVKDYEVNLVIIKDKSVCKNLIRPYTVPHMTTGMPEIFAYPDTISRFNEFNEKSFIPKEGDTATVSFRIPFEIGRSQYKKEDIKAFVDSLKQPYFNPLRFTVVAYSSIEGDRDKNLQLRGQRINSMVQAIHEYSGTKIPIKTLSKESWDLFYSDIVGTDFQFLKPKSKEEISAFIKKGDNKAMLEPILAKQRFAEVQILAQYDISTVQKEEEYVLYMFHKALKEYRDNDALSIQKYIIQKVLSGHYSKYIVDRMNIPDCAAYSGIQMNKLWLQYTALNIPVDAAYVIEMRRLNRQSPTNLYIRRNLAYARLQLEIIDSENYVYEMQREIDALLISELPKHVVDPLNLQLQIKSLEALKTTLKVSSEDSFIQAAFERIKNIIEIQKDDWQGALNLAILFSSMGDYEYPLEIMAPMIHNPSISEEFIFTFLSMCTHTDYMHYTEIFEQALQRAFEINPKKLCELIDTGKISFQIMENLTVKKFYCHVCGHAKTH
ncbi:MAG: hypothetical protein M0R02_09110 [Bacteroidales bacterium]|nr:hypothetical protein [Bacteroidales bacterium]